MLFERGPVEAEVIRRFDDGRVVTGIVDDGFGPVVDEFLLNHHARGDLGSGCTIFVEGRVVVDVYGGLRDVRTAEPWTHETAAVIFSCSKGLLALCAYRLVQEGSLELDEPMATYWPEFAGAGKSGITVRDAMTHRAGLPALDTDLSRAQVLAWTPVIEAIERQRPLFAPGDGHAYHAITFGWLVGEVIRRITGLTPGRFFATSIAAPLGLSTWIGLPVGHGAELAHMEPELPGEDTDEARLNAQLVASDPVVGRGLTMGGAFAFPSADGHVTFNDADILAAEIPGANGVSTAASLARVYAACVDTTAGAALLSRSSIENLLVERSAGQQLTPTPDDGARWGTGFQLASPPSQPMLGGGSFGHAGAGGQLAFADVDHGAAFAYLSNQMGGYGDVRARVLTLALRRCLDR